MLIKLIVVIIFIVSLVKTVELLSICLSRNRGLTETGFRQLGLFVSLLIISGLQLFNVFDFIDYLIP